MRELWLADARGERLLFHIHRWTPEGYQLADRDPAGFQHSAVFHTAFHLHRYRNPHGRWAFDLQAK